MLRDILISMRPQQWLKNFFIFAALLFSRQYLQLDKVLLSLAAFAIFCLLSGAVYLINDVLDADEDRQHENKRNRPVASGRLPPPIAAGAAIILMLAGLAWAFFLGVQLALVALGYFLLMGAYSIFLKHIAIVDVLIIAFGFILRALAGGVAIGVPVSEWLYICTFLLALFIALSKRRHELILLEESAAQHRKSLAEYSPYFFD